MTQILFSKLPEYVKKGLPEYPVSAIRIGKLTIDIQYQKKIIWGFYGDNRSRLVRE